jgi:hypothetical protein
MHQQRLVDWKDRVQDPMLEVRERNPQLTQQLFTRTRSIPIWLTTSDEIPFSKFRRSTQARVALVPHLLVGTSLKSVCCRLFQFFFSSNESRVREIRSTKERRRYFEEWPSLMDMWIPQMGLLNFARL